MEVLKKKNRLNLNQMREWGFFYITVWICVAWRHWSYVTCHKRLFIHRTSDVILVHYESYSYSNKWSQVWINIRDTQEDFIFFFTTFVSITPTVWCYSRLEDINSKNNGAHSLLSAPPPYTHTHTYCRGGGDDGKVRAGQFVEEVLQAVRCTFLFSWN